MPTDLKIWKERVKQAVSDIADKDLQMRSWLGRGPEIFSPEEMFCQFFDDVAIEEFIEEYDVNFNAEQKNAARHLLNLMRQLSNQTPSNGINSSELINNPLMIKSREAAKNFLAIL